MVEDFSHIPLDAAGLSGLTRLYSVSWPSVTVPLDWQTSVAVPPFLELRTKENIYFRYSIERRRKVPGEEKTLYLLESGGGIQLVVIIIITMD